MHENNKKKRISHSLILLNMLLIFNSLSLLTKPPSTLFPNFTISFLPFLIGIFYRSESSDSWFCPKYNLDTVSA